MRTNIVLDDELVAEASRLSGIRTKKELVNEALRVFIASRKRKSLLDLAGKIKLAPGYDYKALRNCVVPVGSSLEERLEDLVATHQAAWSGGKLKPAPPSARLRGETTVADLLIEDRECLPDLACSPMARAIPPMTGDLLVGDPRLLADGPRHAANGRRPARR